MTSSPSVWVPRWALHVILSARLWTDFNFDICLFVRLFAKAKDAYVIAGLMQVVHASLVISGQGPQFLPIKPLRYSSLPPLLSCQCGYPSLVFDLCPSPENGLFATSQSLSLSVVGPWWEFGSFS